MKENDILLQYSPQTAMGLLQRRVEGMDVPSNPRMQKEGSANTLPFQITVPGSRRRPRVLVRGEISANSEGCRVSLRIAWGYCLFYGVPGLLMLILFVADSALLPLVLSLLCGGSALLHVKQSVSRIMEVRDVLAKMETELSAGAKTSVAGGQEERI